MTNFSFSLTVLIFNSREWSLKSMEKFTRHSIKKCKFLKLQFFLKYKIFFLKEKEEKIDVCLDLWMATNVPCSSWRPHLTPYLFSLKCIKVTIGLYVRSKNVCRGVICVLVSISKNQCPFDPMLWIIYIQVKMVDTIRSNFFSWFHHWINCISFFILFRANKCWQFLN